MDNISKLKNTTMRDDIPCFKVDYVTYKHMYKGQYKSYKEYLKVYDKYKIFSSNQLISTYFKKTTQIKGIEMTNKTNKTMEKQQLNLNVVYFDICVRSIYNFTFPYNLTEVPLFFNIKNPTNNELKNIKQVAIVSGNMLYDITIRQGLEPDNHRI